jgi:hypothetical protein
MAQGDSGHSGLQTGAANVNYVKDLENEIHKQQQEINTYKFIVKNLWEICMKHADREQLIMFNTAIMEKYIGGEEL